MRAVVLEAFGDTTNLVMREPAGTLPWLPSPLVDAVRRTVGKIVIMV